MQGKSFKCLQGTLFMVKLTSLIVIEAGQRRLKKKQLSAMHEGFDIDFLGILTVSRGIKGSKIYPLLPRGKYYLVDGQHRLHLLRMLGYEEVCVLLPPGNKGAEVLFAGLNGGEGPTKTKSSCNPNEVFKANYRAGRKPEVHIVKVLHEHGIEVSFGSSTPLNHTRAVDAFKGLHRVTGRQEFSQAVGLLVRNFHRPDGDVEAAALGADFIVGLALYLESTAASLTEISDALYVADRSSAAIIARAKHVAGRNGWVYRQTVANELGRLVKKGSK